jgi:CubicO group peptidase (beta-lactamase class C family)
MRSLSRLLVSCLTLVSLTSPAWAAPAPAELASRVDQVFAEYDKKDSPGCALAVVRDGGIVYSKGYGQASLEHGVPITPQTVFDIGSTSKQITAAAILLLAQDGKLSLDDDIRKFFPEIPDYGTPITLRHLLHHTSGIRDYIAILALGGISFEDVANDDETLAAIARQKALDFRPGDEHSYSNSGYFLLSLVVKKASGKPLREFAQERIFAPLGMTSTQILDDHTRVIPRRAASYDPLPDGGFSLSVANWEQTGDGAVQTTVEDLAKWDQNFYEPKVGGPGLIEQLQTTGVLNSGEKITYARGLSVEEYRGLRRVLHGGAWAGYRAEMIRFPTERFSVITLCNLGSTDPTGLAQQVADLYLVDRLQQPEAPKPAPVQPASVASASPSADLSSYAGLFFAPENGLVRRVYAQEGKLFYERAPGNASELAPLGGNRFAMVGAPEPAEARFVTSSGGTREMHVGPTSGRPIVFQAVEPATPSAEDLAGYAGTYYSEELDVTYTLTVEGGNLVAKTKRRPALVLRPAFSEAFSAPAGGLLRFTRDAGKKVTGFGLTVGRARNLGFTRVDSAR